MRALVFLSVLLSAGAMILPAPSMYAAGAGKSTAFHGTYHGTLDLSLDGTNAKGTVNATGNASTVGKGKLQSTDEGPASLTGCNHVKGTGKLTGKAKARLAYSYQVTFCHGASKTIGTVTITGGSGKLKGARGHGTYTQVFRSGPPGPLDVKFSDALRLS